MPAAITHYLHGQRVRQLLADMRFWIPDENAFCWGVQGPDVFLVHRALPWQRGESLAPYAVRIHRSPPAPFLGRMRAYYRIVSDQALLSYLYGFLCHYTLDSTMHPFVLWAARRLREQDASQHSVTCHNAEESALDDILLRYERGLLPIEFRSRWMLPRSELLQRKIAQLYDDLFSGCFDIQAGAETCYQATQDFRTACRLIDDRTGLKSAFLRWHERHGDHKLSSLFHGISEEGDFDYANTAHAPWRFGKAGGESSAFTLYEQSVPIAAARIRDFLETEDLESLLGRLDFLGREVSR